MANIGNSSRSAAPVRFSPLLHSARFMVTSSAMDNLPVTGLPEIAFVGRSNAGKSTAINTLCQQRQLAFASKTPGRTQHINFFAVGPKEHPSGLLVDLPGYGYAAVGKADKKRWQLFLAQYLAERGPLVGLILLADSRLGLTDIDLSLLEFMAPASVPLHVLLTKADKLNRQEGQRAAQAARDQLAQHAQAVGMTAPISLQLFSATRLSGIETASQLIESWLEDAVRHSHDEAHDIKADPA
ncbi:ribosome biogenesis GTP-binding protein YsxC/EngB [Thiomonas bhubaneswarensis]|uniref:Probable GTP-binding protein EngB n=2 Tax=Thiomonas bhubaneswarensis TaxID=339866 RepID=A0A0K6HU87_9BURK|nr:ribosome biogenesis GTP-binding protein YsxC/EngB [Thiomonas bhubaneswarensis]